MTPFFRSIRWRLQVWYGVPLAVVLAGFTWVAYRFQEQIAVRRVDAELEQRLGALVENLGQPRRRARLSETTPGDSEQSLTPPQPPATAIRPRPRSFELSSKHLSLFSGSGSSYYYVIWLRDGPELSRSATCPPTIPRPALEETALSFVGRRERGELREAYRYTPPGECVLVGHSLADERHDLRVLGWSLSGLSCAVLVVGLGVGWWLAGRAIRPIQDISAAAARIAAGDLAGRVSTHDTVSELGQLAGVLNSTFSRLEAAFAQEKHFTADAAHELRTPVTVILTHAQNALRRERSGSEYRDALAACERAAVRMRKLVDSLLQLARLDAREEPLQRQCLDLAEVARESIEIVHPLADARGIIIQTELSSAVCTADPERIGQVIANLLTNAVYYSNDAGQIRVVTGAVDGQVLLTVSDNGQGIAGNDLPHVFDRFYRADRSRTAAQGRTGLGLAISKAIVEQHGGMIQVSSDPGVGSSFTFRLPAIAGEN